MRLIDIIRNNPVGDYFFYTKVSKFFGNKERILREFCVSDDESNHDYLTATIGINKKLETIIHASGSFLPNMFIAAAICTGEIKYLFIGEAIRGVNWMTNRYHMRKIDEVALNLRTIRYHKAIENLG